ncbi:hypothetical protein NCER_101234 [Vairimorpha ceranae BRL01]|uniref:Cytidine deaminase n=2 Tax=Vairimorpha ceranae TaxID=40302 RepID=C4V9I7_VAIC1|nr:cytidine deaminase [Vairimorpha ceranae]EEQ82114.1 hypothetical protein NCER_101234 [Vairimorpha ceranae BRL01]KAF5140788.1 hypothetical protein G9O61_00g010190 [Vairimorpha ceranae]KKO75470.1 cytidine deaminase [Vairimorpha ceranae]
MSNFSNNINVDKHTKSISELINRARQVRKNAYCPYSKFAVGAAVRTASGEIFIGCNIENSCFSPSICAERAAISQAVSAGHKEIVECAVVAYLPNEYVYPCGVCRQTLAEFANASKDIKIYLAKPDEYDDKFFVSSISELLPGIGKLNLN